MIMIDVLVPPLDRAFDFEVDEKICPMNLIEDVERLIESREKVHFSLEKRELFLYRLGEFVKAELPLNIQGVVNGDRLILI